MGNPQIDGDNIAYPAHMAVVIHRCTANPRPVPARQGEKSVFDLLFMSVYRVKTQRAENALHIPVIRVPGSIVRSGYAAPVLLKENRLPPAAQCHGFPGSQPYFLGFFLPFQRQSMIHISKMQDDSLLLDISKRFSRLHLPSINTIYLLAVSHLHYHHCSPMKQLQGKPSPTNTMPIR